jgi:hypothetical protein
MNQSWQHQPLPGQRTRSDANILWGVAALSVVVLSGLVVALGYHHFHPGLSLTADSEPALNTSEQKYLHHLHAISAQTPAMAWDKSDRELVNEGHVVCGILDANPGKGIFPAAQEVQAWGGWSFNPSPVVLSPGPGSEDRESPIVLPGRQISSQAGMLAETARQYLCSHHPPP